VSPSRRLVVATAYAPPGGDDLAIDHAGAIVVFDAASGAIVRQLTAGPAGGRATRIVRGGRQPGLGPLSALRG
jgi:hypothetical protein